MELNRENVILIEMAEEPREENGETIPGKVRGVQAWIGGRVIPLSYTAFEMIAIQREIGCTAFQVKEEVFGLRKVEKEDDLVKHREEVCDMLKAEILNRYYYDEGRIEGALKSDKVVKRAVEELRSKK